MRSAWKFAGIAAAVVVQGLAFGGDNPAPQPLTKERIAEETAKETPEQKKLREELKAAGGKVYFGGGGQIYVVGFDGAPPVQVTKLEGGASYPHVSPDGKQLIVQQWNSKIPPEKFLVKKLDERYPMKERNMGNRVTILMNIDGSDPRPLCYQWDAHWSPDGKLIAGNINMKDRRKGRPLSVIKLETLEERIVSPDDWDKYKSRGFSTYTPDGKWICSGNPRFIAVPMDESGMKMADGQKPVTIVRSSGCNQEASPDGKWFTWTVDTHGEAGGWIMYAPMDLTKPAAAAVKAKLGWEDKSVNYDSSFSPCSKFMVYMHGDCVQGKKSYDGVPSEIYACRFPPDGVNVQISFLKKNARHPQWVK